MGGYDTATPVNQLPIGDISSKYGSPNYWLRYFTPSPMASKIDADPVGECQAIWDSGGPHLGPISAPTQTNLAGGIATGQADAEAFVDAIVDVYLDVTPLQLPGNNILWCWLDQEPHVPLSSGYWTGWAETMRGGVINGGNHLYPCLYCVPGEDDSCNIVDHATGSAACYGVWSPSPQPCTYDLNNPPPGSPAACPILSWVLWQFRTNSPGSSCPPVYNVDMDVSYLNFANDCFYLSSRP